MNIDFPCPEHPSRIIEGLDPTPGVKKLTYCIDCILESDDPKTVYHRIITFSHFLETATKFYEAKRTEFLLTADHRHECEQLVMQKVEAINNLKIHIEKEKRNLEEAFENIKVFFNELLDKKKAECFKTLDHQIEALNIEYDFFERNIKMYHPCIEDIDQTYPKKETLELMFQNARTMAELDRFVENTKNELELSSKDNFEKIFNDEFKHTALYNFKYQLLQLKLQPPKLETQVGSFKEKLAKIFQKHYESAFHIKNPIQAGASELIISGPAEFFTLRDWLPPRYQTTFSPKLIYKGLKDGMDPDNFYSKCEKKLPTITLIKGKFQDSSDVVVIGGFVEKPWARNGAYSLSRDAFIFSLTSKIKCPIVNYKCASYTAPDVIVAFGAGHDIVIKRQLSNSEVLPHSFMNAHQIVNSPTYKGYGKIKFKPIDIEVYSV